MHSWWVCTLYPCTCGLCLVMTSYQKLHHDLYHYDVPMLSMSMTLTWYDMNTIVSMASLSSCGILFNRLTHQNGSEPAQIHMCLCVTDQNHCWVFTHSQALLPYPTMHSLTCTARQLSVRTASTTFFICQLLHFLSHVLEFLLNEANHALMYALVYIILIIVVF